MNEEQAVTTDLEPLRRALDIANVRERAEECIEGAYREVGIEPHLVLRMLDALATLDEARATRAPAAMQTTHHDHDHECQSHDGTTHRHEFRHTHPVEHIHRHEHPTDEMVVRRLERVSRDPKEATDAH